MQGVSNGGRRCTALEGAGRSCARWSLAGLLLAGASGCSNSDAGSRVAAKATESGPVQVVQRIEPAPVAPAVVAPASAAPGAPGGSRPPAAVPSGSAAATAEVTRGSGEPPVHAEPITSKHLEAELNRLEAELR